ncbi:amidohydrolase [Paenarthrobacter sp. NPDC089675]|uniref:amidohydrolase n=1 Tax=Paenarthrobacter sp. NPDC089675 TaxID=3364376 RepID=UPI00382F6526
MKSHTLLVSQVRVPDGLVEMDLLIRDGRIADLGPAGTLAVPAGTAVEDGAGALALPGMVDAHCHVDKTLWGSSWVPHSAGPALADRIANGERGRTELGLPSREGVHALLRQMAATGTTLARTHTDVDPEIGLRGVELVASVAEELGDMIDVEQVAFPQGGLLTRPGTAELLESALQRGLVGCLGGIDPAALERDSARHLDLIFGLAATYGTKLDIHLHERGSLGAHTMELIIERVLRHGLEGKVAISHGVAIVEVDRAQSEQISRGLAQAGVSLLTATVYNTPVLPVSELRGHGVNVGAGNDGVRDLWGPYGSGDMLDRTFHLAYRSGFRTDEQIADAFDVAVSGGAIALGREPARIEAGAPADLFLIDAASIGEAVAARPPRRLVLKRGKVIARHGNPVGAS